MTEPGSQTVDNPNFEAIIGREIPQAQIKESVQRIGSFYGLPSDRVERADTAKAFIVGLEEYGMLRAKKIREDIELASNIQSSRTPANLAEENLLIKEGEWNDSLKNNPEKLQALVEQISGEADDDIVGECLQGKDGRVILVIKDKPGINRVDVINHEVVHALSLGAYGEGEGFQSFDPVLGRYDYTPLNEAATELMSLCEKYPGVSLERLYMALGKGPTRVAYQEEVMRLIAIMVSSSLDGGTPFTAQDLARHYFQPRKSIVDDKTRDFIADLNSHMAPSSERTVNALVESMEI